MGDKWQAGGRFEISDCGKGDEGCRRQKAEGRHQKTPSIERQAEHEKNVSQG
jgi:hypothetical protein